MKQPLIYISGPISTGRLTVEDNIYWAARVQKILMSRGYAVICPQLTGFVHLRTQAWVTAKEQEQVNNLDHDQWLKMDETIINRCDAIYRMPGESEGADREVQFARENGIPVSYLLTDLVFSQKFPAPSGAGSIRELYGLETDMRHALLDNRLYTLFPTVVDRSIVPAETVVPPVDLICNPPARQGQPDQYQSVTGGVKDSQTGRGDFSLIPYEPLKQVAEHLRLGAAKYSRNNWRKGIGLQRIVSAIRRHAAQLGEDNTENHLAAILCEAMFAVQIKRDIQDGKLPETLDDIDGPFKAKDWVSY